MSMINAAEARAALPRLLDLVEAGEEVTITRHGRAVAVLVRPDALRARRADQALEVASQVRERVAAARGRALSSAGGISAARAEELIAEVRAGREGR